GWPHYGGTQFNRGVAVGDGKAFFGTRDSYLVFALAEMSRARARHAESRSRSMSAEVLGISPETAKRELFNALSSDYFGPAAFACSWASTLCAVSSDRFARASQLAGSTKGCGSPGLRVASSLARSRMPPPG